MQMSGTCSSRRLCGRALHSFTFDLSRNEAIAGVILEVFSHLNDKGSVLSNCVAFGDSLQPLQRFLKLKYLLLRRCLSLERSLEPLKGVPDLAILDVEACF